MVDNVLQKFSEHHSKRCCDIGRKNAAVSDNRELDRTLWRDEPFFHHADQRANDLDERNIVSNRERERFVYERN